MTPSQIRDHLGHRSQVVPEYQEFPDHRELEVLLDCQALQDVRDFQDAQEIHRKLEPRELIPGPIERAENPGIPGESY